MSSLTTALLSSRPIRCAHASRSHLIAARNGGSLGRPCRSGTVLRAYPDPGYIEATKETFENGEKAVADPEEAMCLYREADYVFLDVRSELAFDNIGKVPGSVNIPIIKAKRRFDSETRKNVVETEDLPNFVERVEAKYPDKETRFIVGCATGKKFSIDALIALDEAGYENLVGLKGGYNAWVHMWDNNFRRRGNPKYETVYNADGDGMGIHSTGAGFSMVDELVLYTSDDY